MSDYLANLYSISKDGDISVTNGIPYVRVNGEWLQILIGNRKSLIISELLEEYKDDPFFQDLYEKYCYVRVKGKWQQILIGNRKSLIISDLLEEYKDDPFFQDLYEKYCDLEKEVLMRYKLRKTEEENGNSELSKSTR